MRMSSLITTLNPMTETASPARLIQSPALMVTGSSTLIIDSGRAMLTLFLGDTTLGAGPDRRASAVPLPSAIAQPPISQTDGTARQRKRRGSSTVSPTVTMTATAAAAQSWHSRGWLSQACLHDRARKGKGHQRQDQGRLDRDSRAFTVATWSRTPSGRPGRKGHAMTDEDDLLAQVRRQDEEAELQIAAQLAELRTDEHVSAARRRWGALSKRTRILLITAAVADGALRVAALIDIQRRPASQIRGRKGMWAAAVGLVSSAGVVPISYFVCGRRRQP